MSLHPGTLARKVMSLFRDWSGLLSCPMVVPSGLPDGVFGGVGARSSGG